MEKRKWFVVEVADSEDGFISEYAHTAREAELMAMEEGYTVLYAHEEE